MSENPFVELQNRAYRQARPLTAQLEITYKCNLLCSFCYNCPKERRELTGEEWRQSLGKLKDAGTFNVILTGGEPFCHRDFWSIAEGVREQGLVLKTYTNGLLLADFEKAQRYADLGPFDTEVSLHGADAPTHERLTGIRGSFEKLLRALANLQRLSVKVTLKTPITRLNQHQLNEIDNLGDRFGYKVTYDTNILPTDDHDLKPLELTAQKEFMVDFLMSQVRKGRRGLIPRPVEKMTQNCGTGLNTLTVDPYGDIYPCVAWRRKIANILEINDLRSLWQGEPGTNETLDYVRRKATEVPQATLAGRPEGGFASFCPAVAEKEAGDPLHYYDTARLSGLVRLEAFQRLRGENQEKKAEPNLAPRAESA